MADDAPRGRDHPDAMVVRIITGCFPVGLSAKIGRDTGEAKTPGVD